MPTDYILFVHGVNTRNKDSFIADASNLFQKIQKATPNPSRNLKPVFFFWGDLNLQAQDELRQGLTQSDTWNDLSFQNFRTDQILPFVGDAALYLSRHVGCLVVKRLQEFARAQFQDVQPGDRLHLVTHSWGTVILFDILFARRWEVESLEAPIREGVQNIRNGLFGLPPIPENGIPLSSIHTMGSPLALFSLINLSTIVDGESSHDLASRLKELLANLYQQRDIPLPWYNYLHHNDPIAYPLEGILPEVLDDDMKYVAIADLMTQKGSAFMSLFNQSFLSIVKGGSAHGSYWQSDVVAQGIARTLSTT